MVKILSLQTYENKIKWNNILLKEHTMKNYKKLIKVTRSNLKVLVTDIPSISSLHNQNVLNRDINLLIQNVKNFEKEIIFQKGMIGAENLMKFILGIISFAILLVISKNGQTVYSNFSGIIMVAALIKTRRLMDSNIKKRKIDIEKQWYDLNSKFILLNERKKCVLQIEKERKNFKSTIIKTRSHNSTSTIRQEKIKQLYQLKNYLEENQNNKQLIKTMK